MTMQAVSLTPPVPEPVTIDRVQDKAAVLTDQRAAWDAMYAAGIAEFDAIAKDDARPAPRSIAELASATAIPNQDRDTKRIAFMMGHVRGFVEAIELQEVPGWTATVAASQPLTLPTIQELFAKYVNASGLME